MAVLDRAPDGALTQKPGAAGCFSESGTGGCNVGRSLNGAFSVAASPDGASVYVASQASDAVAVFDRAPNGTLIQKAGTAGCISETGAGGCAAGAGLSEALSVTVSPGGNSVYVASPNADTVAILDRAPDGTLTQKPDAAGCISETGASGCANVAALDGPNSVAVSPDGASVYVASQASDAVAVFDRAPNGTLSQKPGTAGCISTAGAPCAGGNALEFASSVTVSPDGASAYVAARDRHAIAILDRAPNGALTQKPGTAGCVSETGIGGCADGNALFGAYSVTVSPDGANLYAATFASDSVAVFDRELAPPETLPTPPTPGVVSPPDELRPQLTALSLSPARFRAARGGASSVPIGSTVSYRLSEAATVRITVERGIEGRRAGKRCVAPKRSNAAAKPCTRHRALPGSISHDGRAGRNAFRFSGRLRGRRLAPGPYRLRAVATDPAGNSSLPRHRDFQIVATR